VNDFVVLYRPRLSGWIFRSAGMAALICATTIYAVTYLTLHDTILLSAAGMDRDGKVRIHYVRQPCYYWRNAPVEPQQFWYDFYMPAFTVDYLLRPSYWKWSE